MGQVIELAKFRTSKKRAFLKRYDTHLTKFVTQFLDLNLQYTFESIHSHYRDIQAHEQNGAWDYVDFRENLKDAFHEAFGKQLWDDANRLYWFDDRFITQDDLLDRCISRMILGPSATSVRGF